MGKTKEKTSACVEKRYAVGQCDRGRCRRLGKKEMNDTLWKPWKGKAKIRGKRKLDLRPCICRQVVCIKQCCIYFSAGLAKLTVNAVGGSPQGRRIMLLSGLLIAASPVGKNQTQISLLSLLLEVSLKCSPFPTNVFLRQLSCIMCN